MIASPHARSFNAAVPRHRIAGNFYVRRARKRFYFPDKHEWLKVPLVLMKPGRKIGYAVAAVYAFNFGAEYVGVFDVILLTAKFRFRGPHRKLAAFLGVEEAAKNKAR